MSMVGIQDVYILFSITPRSLGAKSFSSALDMLAASVRRWGAKEMDFIVGSGPQNSTAEGEFQVRLGRGTFTAGTGIGTSLPLSTLSIVATSSLIATPAPILRPGNNSKAAGRSTNAIWGSSSLVSSLSRQASVSANQSMAQSTMLNSSAMPASTIESHYTVLPASNSGATVSLNLQASSASGNAVPASLNHTGYLFSSSAPNGSRGAASSPTSISRIIASTRFGSLNMSVISNQCSVGLCPPRTTSSQPVTATTTESSSPSSLNATTNKYYTGGVGNIVPPGGGSALGAGLASTATIIAASTSNDATNYSIPVSSSVTSPPQSSVLLGSTGGSSPVAQSSSSVLAVAFTSSPPPGSLVSSTGTATVNSQSSIVGLEAVEASVAGMYCLDVFFIICIFCEVSLSRSG